MTSLCIGRLVSSTDNIMHISCLVKQASVDLVSDLFGLLADCYGAQSPDAIDTHWSEITLLSTRPRTVQLGSSQ